MYPCYNLLAEVKLITAFHIDHRIVRKFKVERISFYLHLVKPPAQCMVSCEMELGCSKALAACSLKTSEDGDGATFLDNVFDCLNLLLVKNLFLISSLNFPCFSLCLLFHPSDMHFCEEPGSISFIAFSWVWKGCFWVLQGPPPLHAEEFWFPQLFLIG